MDIVFNDMLDYALAYIGDVVVFSISWTDHLKHLCAVLDRLRDMGLTPKPSKYEWATASCSYLDHIEGRGHVQPDECKVAAVHDFVKPVSMTDVHSFLGLTCYYKRLSQTMLALNHINSSYSKKQHRWPPFNGLHRSSMSLCISMIHCVAFTP